MPFTSAFMNGIPTNNRIGLQGQSNTFSTGNNEYVLLAVYLDSNELISYDSSTFDEASITEIGGHLLFSENIQRKQP